MRFLFQHIQHALTGFDLLRRTFRRIDTRAVGFFQTGVLFRGLILRTSHQSRCQQRDDYNLFICSLRSGGNYPPDESSEDGERCDNHEFHVAFIPEDVAVTAGVARDIGVVVVLCKVQFEHSTFGATILQGVDRIRL